VYSISVSKASGIVASGEIGDRPAIHIWDLKTRLNFGVIKGNHQNAISLLDFFSNDNLLVSCG
jgi:WD40 repeat protein